MSPNPELLWKPREITRLGADEAHVWCAGIDTPIDAEAAETMLSSDERARARAFHFDRDRRRYLNARLTLRRLLAGYLEADPASLRFAYGAFGKPALASPAAGAHLQFNQSHCGAFAVYVIARAGPVGIDLEQIRPLDDLTLIATQYFSPEEAARLESLPSGQREEEFFRLWTQCEALGKARGVDLDEALRSHSLDFTPMSWRPRGAAAREIELPWTVTHVRPMNNFLAAVAVGGSPLRLRCGQWEHSVVAPRTSALVSASRS